MKNRETTIFTGTPRAGLGAQVGVPHAVVIGVAALVALLLLLSLCLLTVCLCRRHRKRQQRRASHASIGVKLNGHGPHNGPGGDLCGGTGLDGSGGGSGADHCGADKSLLAGDLDSNGDFPIKQSQTHVSRILVDSFLTRSFYTG